MYNVFNIYAEGEGEEIGMLETNSQIVSKKGKPAIPFYAFISTDIEEEWWRVCIIYI
jgi:hypothetical protein